MSRSSEAINIGGKTPIKMRELEDCFAALGYCEITTYLNTGNVIFETDASVAL